MLHPPPISTLFPYTTLFRSLREHFGQIRRVVLQIAVERGDDAAAGGLDSGPEGGALAVVLRMTHAAHAGIQPMRLMNFLPGAVTARVVHEDQFKRTRFLVQRAGDFAR